MRTPQSVSAAGGWRISQARRAPGLWSSAVSLVATFVLLMLVGPIAALVGILLGETVATERTFALARRLEAAVDE